MQLCSSGIYLRATALHQTGIQPNPVVIFRRSLDYLLPHDLVPLTSTQSLLRLLAVHHEQHRNKDK